VQFPFVFTDIIGLAVYCLVIPLEFVRLLLGYRGNLLESAPALTSFLIASVFFELPLLVIAFLRNGLVVFELCANLVLAAFLLGT
jgi:hypothetical protein